MKKIILLALCWPIFSYPLYAQKDKKTDENREIIIIKNGKKEKKLTIETKDGETYINGKKASEYNDDDVAVIRNKFKTDAFSFAPGAGNVWFNNSGDKKAFLGVTTEKVDNGAKITNLNSGSAAQKAGLKEGDVITRLGNKKISGPDDLTQAVGTFKPKDEVKITYERNGKTDNATATLGSRDFMRAISFNNNSNGQVFNRLNGQFDELRALKAPLSMYYSAGRGRLGIGIEDTENSNGVKVTSVADDSPAEKAGLKKDDIITAVNGKSVKDISDIRKELSDVKDNSYSVKVNRNGSDMNLEVKIPKRLNKASL